MPSKFTVQIQSFARQVKAKTGYGAREALKELVRRLIDKSPVGILGETSTHPGLFKGNWLVTPGALPNTYDSSIRDVSGAAALAKALAVIDALDLSRDWIVYISNHVPYAVTIEYGNSEKRWPDSVGMVRITAAEFADIVKGSLTPGNYDIVLTTESA